MISTFTETVPLRTDDFGVMKIGETRVTLDTVLQAFKAGETPEEIALSYPAVSLADVYGVIGFYLRHQEEIEDYLLRRKEESLRVRTENSNRFNQIGIRQRLLARRK